MFRAMQEFETPRIKIPIPIKSRTQATSIYQTPIATPMVRTPLSTKSEPHETNRNIKMMKPNNIEIQFAMKMVESILLHMKQLNANIPKKTLQSLTDKKQQKIVIETLLMAPIITHLIKSCMKANRTHQKQHNHQQLLSFFIDYFEQIYTELIWPKPQQIGFNISDNHNTPQHIKPSVSKHSTPHTQNNTTICNKSIEIRHTPHTFAEHNASTSRSEPPIFQKAEDKKFDAFIEKVNAIGNKFEIFQKCTDNNKTEICDKLKEIEHKQQELDHKIKHNNSTIANEWEKSHHHLGKKQQQNIDLLQHQTKKFEEISQRIKNALKETEDPKIYEARLNFITQHTKDLEQKLEDVQNSIANKAKTMKQSVQNALNKYREMENVTDLISIGVSPHNLMDTQQKEKENNESDKVIEEERKLSFLNKFSQSDTGFNYDQKRNEIKSIMSDVLECKYKIDDYHKVNDLKSFKMKVKEMNVKKDYNLVENETDQQFRDRIKKRVQATATFINDDTPKCPPSLHVHWDKDGNKMKYIQEKDLNKLMTLKPGIARRYRESNKYNTKTEMKDEDSFFECNINKPPMNEILQRAKHRIESKQKEAHILKSKKQMSPKCSANEIKVVRRTTKKPPELQFYSKPIPPTIVIRKAVPNIKRKKSNCLKKKKIEENNTSKRKRKHKVIHVSNTLLSKSIQTVPIILQTSIKQDIQSMASCKEAQDTVSLLTHSQNNLSSFCDDVLNQIFTQNNSNIDKSLAVQNAEQILGNDNDRHAVESILNDIIHKCVIMAENKQTLCVEEKINQQNIATQSEIKEVKDKVKVVSINTLEEDTQTIVHISSTIPKQTLSNIVEPKVICRELQYDMLPIISTPAITTYPVTSTMCTSVTCSAPTSACTSAVSSVPTSMLSSFNDAEMKSFLGIKVSDSVLSGISISASESIMADSSDSDESEDFDNLKESLNREWNEIQLALHNLNP